MNTINWDQIQQNAIQNIPPSKELALQLLELPDSETLRLVDVAWKVRQHFFSNTVKVNKLLNVKAGFCAEDCGYCSQSRTAESGIDRYPMLDKDSIMVKAREAQAQGAQRFCIVSATRGPSWKDIDNVAEATRQIKAELNLEVCACLGLLDDSDKAQKLKDAGVDAYNHNLNTTQKLYDEITTTHNYQDRVDTLDHIKAAGISACSGVILGMGESNPDVVDMAYSLRNMGAGSIPVNFLMPIEGTKLGGGETISHFTPWYCLRALAIFRLINSSAEVRASAGREIHLRTLQPLALMIANSLFLGDYLTEEGQEPSQDWNMISDLGLVPQKIGHTHDHDHDHLEGNHESGQPEPALG